VLLYTFWDRIKIISIFLVINSHRTLAQIDFTAKFALPNGKVAEW
jgi:hypothetical protein